MNQVAEFRPAGAVRTEEQSMVSLVLFMTGELLPEMIFHWPVEAKKVGENLQGAAQGYARPLCGQGFTPALIRRALQAEVESEREFMPKPIELANRCRELMGHQQRAERPAVTASISPAAVRMMAESRLWCAEQQATDEQVRQEAARVAEEYRARGVKVSGEGW
ncbi:hypothetical protein [Oceanimonas smirnovii]|uniref:hypothetical protein n=1 Tax=Oceanimonas smirnovii TaxID=264574 RepID=UPI00037C70AD|nr:hypothetical protein [Oceanimonas smirnovii]